MLKRKRYTFIIAGFMTVSGLGLLGGNYWERQSSPVVANPTSIQEIPNLSAQPITPLPLEMKLDSRKVALGERLFKEPKLSGDNTISCEHCHNLSTGGVDRLTHSFGIDGQEGIINTPTVFNSGNSFRQFWNGRAETLESQMDGPLQNSIEMGSTWPHVIASLSEDSTYQSEFSTIYKDGIQADNVRDAIATFERSLNTPNSRFDRFLRGNKNALNEEEKAGFQLFKQLGCISCHQGMNIGGNMFQKLGIMEDYFAVRGHQTMADMGRFNVTKQEKDRHYFKVPSLRNIALTPPYLHDGSQKKLEDVVKVMARFQLGTQLDEIQISQIVAFLRSLTGEYKGIPLQ